MVTQIDALVKEKLKNNDELLTMQEVANFLKISIHTMYKNWTKFGIAPVVAYPGAKPRFWKSDILRLIVTRK